MDPDETLRELRQAYSDCEDTLGALSGPATDAASRLRDAAVALDEWLSRGGFLPTDWGVTATITEEEATPPRQAGDLRPGDLVYQQAPRGRGVLEHVVRRVAPGPHGVVTIYFSEDFTWVLPVGRLVEARRPGIG